MRPLQSAIWMAIMLALASQTRHAPGVFAHAGDAPARQAVGVPTSAPDFKTWLVGVRQEALARGFRPETVSAALDGLEPLPVVVERDRSQAETVLSLEQYLSRRLTRPFLRTARQEAARHRPLLTRVGSHYGVQGRFVLAIWGIESNFGRFTGTRPVIQALATLAWDGRRGPFFRGELLNALEIIDRGYIGLDQLRGSWAGAMGQPQFMPSSYLKFAQDFDRDGDRDIWKSHGDIFASVANYLKSHGWSHDQTWGREVKLPASGADRLFAQVGRRAEGCRAEREMSQRALLSRWQALGVRTVNGGALPKADLEASLVHAGGRAFLVYGNYEAILEYNCAHTYALSVALLADRTGM